jgi:hypothetical protein
MSDDDPVDINAIDARVDPEDIGTEPRHGPPTEALLFLGIAAFTLVIGMIYAVTTTISGAFEPAGTFVLVGTAGFAGWFGVFLLRVRDIQEDVEVLEQARVAGDRAAADVLYLPAHSIWPLGLAVGLALMLAGIPLGFWVLIPGVAVFVQSVVGFAHQTRSRS